MATIKIDRGFTQKIQQKGMLHTPTSQPPPPPPKKSAGWQTWMTFAAAGAVAVLVLIVIVSLVTRGARKPTAAKPPPPPAAAAKPAPLPAARETDAVEPAEAPETLALYAKTPEKASATQPAAAAPPPAAPAAQPQRRVIREVPPGSPQGLLCEYYEQVKGGQVSDLRAAATFPGQPSRTVQVGRFELSEGLGENYGVRVRGYVVPPKTGAYTFVVNVDDGAELWLSTDDQPANIRRLVRLTTHTRKRWTERPEQESAAFDLTGGKRYYLEVLMKQGTGGDYLAVGWKGPVSDTVVVIDALFLQPWAAAPAPAPGQTATVAADASASAAAERRKAKAAREEALAPAQAAVAEQRRAHGAAYRYAEAAQALKDGRAAWRDPAALALIETAILRFELLGRLRAFVQSELARARLKGVWVAFGGQADVTGASDEGVTVAPGRIVAWAKVPPDQMLRLINALLSRATLDSNTKGTLFLAGAVFCKEVSGGTELALKYRERAISFNSALAPLAERVLGGTPESILAEPRLQAARAELGRLSAAAAALAEKVPPRRAELEKIVTALQQGLTVEFWENVTCRSIDEVRSLGITTKNAPDSTQHIADFATPEAHGEKYFARVKGYLTPPATGEYLFYMAADDQGEFWLSPDEDAEKAALCLKVDAPVGRRQWDPDKRKSKPVALVKGSRYFVKALLREGEKGDFLAVAWSLASEEKPALITSESLLCAPGAELPPRAQELRKQIGDDLQSVQASAAEIARLRDEDEALADAQPAATAQSVSELQKQVERAKEALRAAESALQRADAAQPPLKAALQPEAVKPN